MNVKDEMDQNTQNSLAFNLLRGNAIKEFCQIDD